VLLILAVLASYRHSLSGPFIFDDTLGIERNLTIRQLWPPGSVLSPPFDTSVSGRPVANLSLALNYAWSGLDLRGLHAANIAIHLAAVLALWGVLRRTLARCGVPDAAWLALAATLLWAVHPLQTEAVTYLIQRIEALMGLFYLLALYCFIRGADWGRRANLWFGGCALACLLGMGTKEVAVSAPVMVLFYDRTFVSGTFRGAWRRRWGLYLALAGSWIWVAALAFGTRSRNGTAGFGAGVGVRWWDYALTQFPAVVRYLGLAAWPRRQIFDYGTQWEPGLAAVGWQAAAVAGLLGASAWAFLRPAARGSAARALGYAGLWFFAILAPTSLIPGNRQTMAEHRMYLALIPVLVLGLVAARAALAFLLGRRALPALLAGCAVAACLLGRQTLRRNADYASRRSLWQDTAEKAPANPYAHNNLGNALVAEGRPDAALVQYREAIELKPDYAEAHNNLGTALVQLGRIDEGSAEYAEAMRLKPAYNDPYNNLGVALIQKNDVAGAIAEFAHAVAALPRSPEAHFNLGQSLLRAGRTDEGLAEYRRAHELGLDGALYHNDLGNGLAAAHRLDEAEREYLAALRLQPDYAEAYANFGLALSQQGRFPEALAQFRRSLELKPELTSVRFDYANVLVRAGQLEEAEAELRAVVSVVPRSAPAQNNLADLLLGQGKLFDAESHFAAALQVNPGYAPAEVGLGLTYLRENRTALARLHFQRALALRPDDPAAKAGLARLAAGRN
jgi:tetratricopeptide (TPR) repeat protein